MSAKTCSEDAQKNCREFKRSDQPYIIGNLEIQLNGLLDLMQLVSAKGDAQLFVQIAITNSILKLVVEVIPSSIINISHKFLKQNFFL